MAEITFGEAYSEAGKSARSASLVHIAGGLVSLGLIVGIAVWGGKIIMRDVTGVPVVRAMTDGPMRVAPENPGGDVAAHAGLTVNAVAAVGEAAPPEDRLVLAPQSVDLADEDLQVSPVAEAVEVAPVAAQLEGIVQTASDSDAPLTAEEVLALADRIAAEADSISPVIEPAAAPATSTADAVLAAVETAVGEAPNSSLQIIAASVPGVARSIRPTPRPGVTLASAPADPVATAPVVTQELPEGTKLVQLGAYDSPELAQADWTRISGRFADFMGGKSPVIQQAESGGRTFFRLRAQGFADLSDARRFCSVLMAENAACIPVVVR